MAGRDATSSAGSAGRRSNLPVQLTSFVAREAERHEVKRLLAGTRLLTLTGTGGVGKTRLALEVARELTDRYADGVWLVELAALSDGALVPQAVASALGVGEDPGEPLPTTLASELRDRRSLVILDNCEHLIAACADLAYQLLSTCPAVQILAASREPLDVPGELIWRVPPLDVPDPRVALGTDEIAVSAAVALFVDRARLVVPGFAVGDRNAGAVAEICRRLDGIPLAIELAAARLRSLGVVEIAERLDDHLPLLTSTSRATHPRHRTLRATVDWSYELLTEPERQTLRRLGVFAGGWSLEAAQAVVGAACPDLCEASPDCLHPRIGTLDRLTQLVDRSLVQVDHQGGRVRYRLLETIRQYADERLREAGERPTLRRRHADWLLALAERAGPALRGPDQVAWVERLELEHENVRAALVWTIEEGDAARGLRLGRALWRFWSYRGYLTEGRRRLDAILVSVPKSTRSPMLPEVLFAAGRLAHQQGDRAAARDRYETVLTLAEEVSARESVIGALTQLGHLALDDDDLDAARDWYERALLHRDQVGDCGEVAVALAGVAYVSQIRADYTRARALIQEGLALVERLGDRSLRAFLVCRLGDVAVDEGQFEEAHALLAAGLRIYQELGARSRLSLVLEGFARLAAARGQAALAVRLAGAAVSSREKVSARPTPRQTAWLGRWLEPARQQLGIRASEEAWAAGRAMSLEASLSAALADDARRPRRPARASPSGDEAHQTFVHPPAAPAIDAIVDPLTPRERDVVVLVARGLTNRQIGETLVITEGTATLHVKHVLSKLGFASRAQIAAWVVQHGLSSPRTVAVEQA